MYYEINVSEINKAHVFTTAPRSITTIEKLREILKLFEEKFPRDKYQLQVTRHESFGHVMDYDNL